MGNEQTYTVDCSCCTPTNPCPNDDPPLEVTVSWTAAPTSHSGWELTTAGSLDMFNETWTNGETKQLCPTTYAFVRTLVSSLTTRYRSQAYWMRSSIGTRSFILSNSYYDYGSPKVVDNVERVKTTDGAQIRARGFGTTGETPTPNPTLGSDFTTTSIASYTGVSPGANFQFPVDFDHVGGSLKTSSDGITIVWAKSSFFPAGNP